MNSFRFSRLFALVRTLVYMTGFVWLWGWLALSARALDAEFGMRLPLWLRPAGVGLMTIGAVVALGCGIAFSFRGRGTPAPFDAPREFVAVGPYQYVRNPMYVGALGVLIGYGFYVGSPGVLALAMAAWLLAHVFVTLVEEPSLEAQFGETYRAYKRSVNRWLPRWK